MEETKHCSGHARHFPNESFIRPLMDFNRYKQYYQPQCRRCNGAAMEKHDPLNDAKMKIARRHGWASQQLKGHTYAAKYYTSEQQAVIEVEFKLLAAEKLGVVCGGVDTVDRLRIHLSDDEICASLLGDISEPAKSKGYDRRGSVEPNRNEAKLIHNFFKYVKSLDPSAKGKPEHYGRNDALIKTSLPLFVEAKMYRADAIRNVVADLDWHGDKNALSERWIRVALVDRVATQFEVDYVAKHKFTLVVEDNGKFIVKIGSQELKTFLEASKEVN